MNGLDFNHLERDVAIGVVFVAIAGWGVIEGLVRLYGWVATHMQWVP